MAYAPKANPKGSLIPLSAVSKISVAETALASDCATYTVPQAWINDKNDGELGPAALQALNEMCAAMASGVSHYVARQFQNDKTYGHLGPDLLAKLNAMSAYVATLRP